MACPCQTPFARRIVHKWIEGQISRKYRHGSFIPRKTRDWWRKDRAKVDLKIKEISAAEVLKSAPEVDFNACGGRY